MCIGCPHTATKMPEIRFNGGNAEKWADVKSRRHLVPFFLLFFSSIPPIIVSITPHTSVMAFTLPPDWVNPASLQILGAVVAVALVGPMVARFLRRTPSVNFQVALPEGKLEIKLAITCAKKNVMVMVRR